MTNWIHRVARRRKLEAEMREEMAFHIEERAADLRSRGMSEAEAARQARMEFGNAGGYEEECRSALGYRMLDELRADARYALRGVRKSPGFTIAAVSILGLAIGANSVFFTLYNNFILKPMPIRGAERHFDIEGRNAQSRGTGWWLPAEVAALREGTREQIEGLYTAGMFQVLMVAPEQRQVLVMTVSGNYFSLLGAGTILGRVFGEEEEREPLAVLSETGWRKLTGSDPRVVGRTLRVRSTVFTVIGVAQPEFTGTEAAAPDFWVPRGMQRRLRVQEPGAAEEEMGDSVFGLLKPGVGFEEAEAALTGVASRLERPEDRRVARVEVTARPSYLRNNAELKAASALVFAAFLMVLLIACANLANLYLSRAGARTHEIGVRLSLGASRSRIVRQLLTESTLTALMGAAAGLGLAAVGIGKVQEYVFSSMAGMGIAIMPVTLDWRVFVYAAGLGGLAGVAFGLLPAIESTHPSLASATKKDHSLFAGRVRPRRMRDALIGGQVAASLVLLVLSGVLIRNLQRLEAVEAGFDLERVLDLKVQWPAQGLLNKLAQVEGVASVSGVSRVPLYGRLDRRAAMVNGVTEAVGTNVVDERYFETLELKVTEGRGFTRAEAEAGARVAVVSAATARRLWPGAGSAVGRRIEFVEEGPYEIVGVVPDVVSGWFFEGADSTMLYMPAAAGSKAIDSAVARVDGNVGKAVAAMRKVCAEAGGCEPASLRGMATVQRFPFQVAAAVAGLLGALALMLTGVGLYGVVSYSVIQRRREIGVHVALGASPWMVVGRVVGEAWRCVGWGVLAGLPVCLALSKLGSASVLQIQTFDAGAYVAVPLLLAAVTAVSCLVPARRAARVDAMLSLREE